jgi:hypothetical protein
MDPERMSVANDLDPVAEEQRKHHARSLIEKSQRRLLDLRAKSARLDSGDAEAWREAGAFAQMLIREATPLDLPLLVACAREVLLFAEKRLAGEPLYPHLVLYMLSALDTVGMELDRLRHDRSLK